ncbi:MAG: chromosomal replication initiator protein DnaA [Cellulomonadaceae bacterium]|jgi:chromosomal replication initiator protein|nr:chromosomal replication initiator protein DnaA [Cellulomonadaceae bacterium]
MLDRHNVRADDLDVADVWAQTLRSLEADYNLNARQLSTLRKVHPVGINRNVLYADVAHETTRGYLEGSLGEDLMSALSEVLGCNARFAININPSVNEDIAGPTAGAPVEEPEILPANHAPIGHSTPQPAPLLNPKYHFDSFIIGSSNRFAHAAALAVAEAPAKAYNPLFVYGGSGLGKTHLLHAIGHYAHNLYPTVRVRYVTSEGFLNDFINAVREGKEGGPDLFKRNYRDVDILLIDDIQFLQGKKETMEEFFHTFNHLHQADKQVVITSDQHPDQLQGFEERLRTRFKWGLLTDIQTPDVETRIAILRRKSEDAKYDISPDVLGYIGARITTNIRELEGALTRVAAYASLNQKTVDPALAEVVLRDVLFDNQVETVTPTTIISETASYFGVSVEDLTGTRRTRELAVARQVAMYLVREMTGLSFPKTAELFSRKDHTTILYAFRKVESLMAENVTTYNQVSDLTTRIKQKAPAVTLAA